MKRLIQLALSAGFTIFASGNRSFGADQITLQFKQSAAQGEVDLHSQLALPVGATYPEYTILSSSNLVDWQAVAGPVSGSVGVSDELLRVAVPLAGEHAFYRVTASVKLAPTGNNAGEAVYGYGTEFNQWLQRLGQLSLDDFVRFYGLTNQYLPQISFDPTTAEFWDLWNMDPAVWNATNSWPNRRLNDFRLNTNEFTVFQTNGFVVSQRMQRQSFADVFYDIYTDELPIFVTTDAILHAWHRTFLSVLTEIEETSLSPKLSDLLNGMAAQVPALWTQSAGTAITNGVLDADYFLAVAQSLASGVNNYGSLGQTARVNTTLNAINALLPAEINLYGEDRAVDFSQFQVRGQYTSSAALSQYFRAMMWCALADFRYAGFPTGEASGGSTNTLRELSGAVALEFLLQNSGQFTNWLEFNQVVELFVGSADSLTFAQLGDLLEAAGVSSPSDLPGQASLTNLQNQLMTGQLGMKQITSGYFWSPFSADQVKLPRSFTVMGQRFVMDSWAFGKCTFDSIIWDEDGIPGVEDKVLRRVPSALDIAFSVLGNSQVVPVLADRISRTNLVPADGRPYWRDGRKYQHNLGAVRDAIDSQDVGAWTNSIYNHWLACLRELSSPTTAPQYPEAMRTRAWAMKTVNTQLASWTELRHNTVLYAEQSYTPLILCLYPKGYVEPRPTFWKRMVEMAGAMRGILATLSTNGVFTYTHYTNDAYGDPVYFDVTVSGATMYTNRLMAMDRFLNALDSLCSISKKELNKNPLSSAETLFLQDIVEVDYTGARTYGGWYPQLYYQPASQYVPPPRDNGPSGDNQGSDYWDPLVTDVHTDLTDVIVGDPGSVLHEGVGNIYLLMISVDSGPSDKAVYAGPVLSHYEFELGPTTRQTDEAWKSQVSAGTLPPQPEWTSSYLVPNP
jgi:hypothetical protein